MKIAVLGTGYVGLVSGVCLAAKGHDVTCVDVNPEIVSQLNRGRPHIHERGLTELLESVLKNGNFRATTELSLALEGSALVIIAVGTPSRNGEIDLSYIQTAAAQVGNYVKKSQKFISVIIKSTVVPGTTDTVVKKDLETHSGLYLGCFGLGMNPEFLREGEAIEDFMNPDRIVLGYEDPQTLSLLQELYAPWHCEKLCVPTRTAEMIKYANNSMLALQISAMNELANLATRLGGIDMLDVVKGVILDKRWSPLVDGKRVSPGITTYLLPGCGFGGSCFPKDVQAVRSLGRTVGVPMHVLDGVLAVNEAQPGEVARILLSELGALQGRNVLLLGLAFKPGTDDVRETASLPILRDLLAAGAHVKVHDPIAVGSFKSLLDESELEKIGFVCDWRDGFTSHEVLIVATKWDEYSSLRDHLIEGQVLFDVRRMFDPSEIVKAIYLTVGRRVSMSKAA